MRRRCPWRRHLKREKQYHSHQGLILLFQLLIMFLPKINRYLFDNSIIDCYNRIELSLFEGMAVLDRNILRDCIKELSLTFYLYNHVRTSQKIQNKKHLYFCRGYYKIIKQQGENHVRQSFIKLFAPEWRDR